MHKEIYNINIKSQKDLISPSNLLQSITVSAQCRAFVAESRESIYNILQRQDPRLVVVVGPCSIHDVDAAMVYANKLKLLAQDVAKELFIVMRVYFEKPRTSLGWKGLINDPDLNNSFQIEKGLSIGRKLLADLADFGIPTATEALDPILPQYLQDLITWSAIGARTTESQVHRSMASGLSMPVGFKNATDGSLDIAINALESVIGEHSFLGINTDGRIAVTTTRGNNNCHIILRGGKQGPNYAAQHIATCEDKLKQANLQPNIMVDCSHDNSNKDHNKQILVVKDIIEQIKQGNTSIIGLMLESNLNAGKQSLVSPDKLEYGVSITDACIDFKTTAELLYNLAKQTAKILPLRNKQS